MKNDYRELHQAVVRLGSQRSNTLPNIPNSCDASVINHPINKYISIMFVPIRFNDAILYYLVWTKMPKPKSPQTNIFFFLATTGRITVPLTCPFFAAVIFGFLKWNSYIGHKSHIRWMTVHDTSQSPVQTRIFQRSLSHCLYGNKWWIS